MARKSREKKIRKGKRKVGWFIAIGVIVILGAGILISWSFLSKEHKEAMNLPINAVDFSKLNDGTYTGKYEGGIYKWRANEVQVTISSGKVTNIEQLSAPEAAKPEALYHTIHSRVIESQSLQVDTISSATLTSKAYLKAVEDALVKALE